MRRTDGIRAKIFRARNRCVSDLHQNSPMLPSNYLGLRNAPWALTTDGHRLEMLPTQLMYQDYHCHVESQYPRIAPARGWVISMATSHGDITSLLHALRHGDRAAGDKLFPLVYSELHRLARSYMRRERPNHTLQPTALINEAYLRLAQASIDWQNRAHFIGVAANAMRRILVDHARAHMAGVRGGDFRQVEWDDALGFPTERSRELVALDEALQRLEKLNPRQAKTVELRYIGGLSFEEVGAVLNVSPRTAKRDWALARLWLFKRMGGTPSQDVP
jgi:RNA polymerase sigma-70 factor, ECF subfamily